MSKKSIGIRNKFAAVLTTAVLLAITVPACAAANRSESQYARELSRLGQVAVLKLEAQRAKGTPNEGLYDAQLVYATWGDLAKDHNGRSAAIERYMSDLTRYTGAPSAPISGFWALDHAKFILGPICETTVNRMEYWSNSANDRKTLKPMADMAHLLLDKARSGLQAAQQAAESPVFDQAAWDAAFASVNEVDYYAAYDDYFTALAMEPGDGHRAATLSAATDILTKWADEDDSDPSQASGIKFQCLLLRGKCYSEGKRFDVAAADFATAGTSDQAPGWVRYQSYYQAVVNKIRKNDGTAESELDKFKAWIASNPNTANDQTAKISAEMLRYRVEAAEADVMTDENARKDAMNKALGILDGIVQQDPRYRDLVFEQLAALAPDGASFASLPPLEALAVAWTKVQSVQDDKDPDGRKVLASAIDAAEAVQKNTATSDNNRKEAILVSAVADQRLGRLTQAVQMNLTFARLCYDIEVKGGPKDPRGQQAVNAALSQLGDLRTLTPKGQPQPKQIEDLSAEALDLAAGKYGDHKWDYAHALTLVQEGKLQDAAVAMQGISQTDPNYYPSRYQLLRVNLQLLEQSTNADIKMQTARSLLESCHEFLNPAANAPAEAKRQADENRSDILLIEIGTALDPLKDAPAALAALDELEKQVAATDAASKQPEKTSNIKGVILRDRIKAYQISGNAEGATETMRKYLDQFPKEAPNIIRGMISEDIGQFELAEKTDPAKAKEIAADAVNLVKALIDSTKTQPNVDPKTLYSYNQILADMESRAGQTQDAIALFKVLQGDPPAGDPKDLFNFMGEARAIYADGQWKMAHDYFARIIPKLTLGSESYWDAYYRMIKCNEQVGGSDATVANKKVLQDLHASYGDATGGTALKTEYADLLKKYDVQQ